MKRIGTNPQFGIPLAEEGLFISSLGFDGTCSEVEHKDHQDNCVGLTLYDPRVSISLEAEFPEEFSSTWSMGAELVLKNETPASSWLDGVVPTATTTVMKAPQFKYGRSELATVSVTATQYAFAA